MACVVQVGTGSGGMAVLDLVGRDARINSVLLIEPDIYKPHNVVRHYFAPDRCGQAHHRGCAHRHLPWHRQQQLQP